MRARLVARSRSDHGQSALDYFTPFHFLAGFAAGVYGVSPVKAALVLTVLKIGVASLEHGSGHALFSRARGESNLNELCDLLAEIAGVDAGAQLRNRWNPQPDFSSPPPPPPAPPGAAPVSGIFRLR